MTERLQEQSQSIPQRSDGEYNFLAPLEDWELLFFHCHLSLVK